MVSPSGGVSSTVIILILFVIKALITKVAAPAAVPHNRAADLR
jgi:hypothetical protein